MLILVRAMSSPGLPSPESTDLAPTSHSVPLSAFDLLPAADLSHVSAEVTERTNQLQMALRILGPAGGSVLVCPGNQVGLEEYQRCPYSAKCELLRAQVAPQGSLCPHERDLVATRFTDWSTELGRTPTTLSETDRSFVSDMVWLDTQAHRCTSILSKGEAARLTQLNPKETHPETLEPISWERVIHVNVERLDQITTQRRMLLRDWMLTPEQKAKKARWEGKSTGDDLSTQQSTRADKLRGLDDIIEAEFEVVPA